MPSDYGKGRSNRGERSPRANAGGKRSEQRRQGHRPSQQANYAKEADAHVIFGRNAVKELLASGRDIDKIFTPSGTHEGSVTVLVAEAIARKIPVVEVDRRKLDEMCAGENHQGIVAMAAERNYASVEDILAYAAECGEPALIAIADGIEDPHNLGALIRCAECAGVHGLIVPKRRSVGLTSVVAKASAGAIEHLRIAKVTNLPETIERLKEQGVWVYSADMQGTAYEDLDFTTPSAIVFGSEGNGVSRLVSERCDFVVSIPMYGQVNSMNVSTASAVVFSEAARQRHRKK